MRLNLVSVTAQQLLQSNKTLFSDFRNDFAYQGDDLYGLIFERNKDRIKVSKEKFAIKNLKKIFDATFQLSAKIGFQAMSLRDLSTATGLSMGGLYSSISSKEAIAVIVKDVVSVVCAEIVEEAREQKDPKRALEVLMRGYLYASTIMQPWFYFLYFETKSLPSADQEGSLKIELIQVKELETLIGQLTPNSDSCHKAEFVATMALSLIQERYLKHWKYKNPSETIDEYADKCLQLIYRAICLDEVQPCTQIYTSGAEN
jgi:AcrR family transcriptional regulator